MRVKKFAQSTLLVSNDSGTRLLVDPGRYNFESGRLTYGTFPVPEIIAISHKHDDHFDIGFIRAMFRKNNATILTNLEVLGILKKEGIDAGLLEEEKTVKMDGFSISGIKTNHISYGEKVMNVGMVVSSDSSNIYYTSDTLFMNPPLLPENTKIGCLFLPLSGRGSTMNSEEAIRFAKAINPELIIPVHYDSPKDRDLDLGGFANAAVREGLNVRILNFGEEIRL